MAGKRRIRRVDLVRLSACERAELLRLLRGKVAGRGQDACARDVRFFGRRD